MKGSLRWVLSYGSGGGMRIRGTVFLTSAQAAASSAAIAVALSINPATSWAESSQPQPTTTRTQTMKEDPESAKRRIEQLRQQRDEKLRKEWSDKRRAMTALRAQQLVTATEKLAFACTDEERRKAKEEFDTAKRMLEMAISVEATNAPESRRLEQEKYDAERELRESTEAERPAAKLKAEAARAAHEKAREEEAARIRARIETGAPTPATEQRPISCGPDNNTRMRVAQSNVPGAPADPSLDPRSPILRINNLPVLDGSGNYIRVNLPSQSFLARELQGSGVQQLNQVNPSRTATGAGGTFKFTASNPAQRNATINAYFAYYNASASSTGAFDPGAGFRLNLPGAEGGPSGVSIGGNPLNVVTGFSYNNNIEGFSGGGGIRVPIVATPGGFFLDGGISIIGNRLNANQSFRGQIPGFGRDFIYTTDVNVNSAQLDLSLGLSQALPAPGGIFIINGELKVAPATISGNGTDRFNFTGITPSQAGLSRSTVDAGYGATVGVTYMLGRSPFNTMPVLGGQPSPPVTTDLGIVSIYLAAGYESRPGFPVIERDGTNPSRLELKSADFFNVGGGVRLGFGAR